MAGSLIVSLTLIPVLSSWFLKIKEEKDSFLVRHIKRKYMPLLEWGLKRRAFTIGLAVLLFIVSLSVLPFIGTEFIPILEEGSIQVRVTNIPSASLDEAIGVATRTEKVLLQFPEVKLALSKIGRAEKGDTEEVNNIETYVEVKPLEEWRKGFDKHALTEQMHRNLEAAIPGVLFSFGQPIQMRVDELISGIRAMLAVKIYGEDLNRLSRLAELIKGILGTMEGATDLQVETVTGKPALNIRVNREAAARYGLNVDDVLETVRAGVGGEAVGRILDGVRQFDIVVRFDEESRKDVEKISAIPIRTQAGALVPLSKVAEISLSSGLARIRRESLSRYIVIQANVVGRDIGGFVSEAQQKIAQKIKVPQEYYMDWGGQFENQRRAMRTLSIVVPITIFLIFVLLYTAFNSVKYALLIISNVPFSAIGGIIALLISGQYLSVPSAIGFITVFGVAMLNGVVLVSYFVQLRNQGMELGEVVRRGCLLRLRPVLMTATVAILGLVPLLVSTGVGAEVQRPLAAVVVGGLITSTALTLLILPLIYFLVESRTKTAEASFNSDSEEKT
jgi:cobalt-zinc-cadmium resistance protein CzcA